MSRAGLQADASGRTGAPAMPLAHADVEVPSAEVLKRAFSLFPSGVVIATTLDASGQPHGFTASSFTPLSLEPPMVLICLNVSAQCFSAFSQSDCFAVSVLRPEHREQALRFATRGADKFGSGRFRTGALGLPQLADSLATFACRVAGRYPGGDHVILTGHVEQASYEDTGSAMVHFVRSFREQPL
ncbi:MAG: flavin reductase family protein [Pseudomonadota bacterium]|jgi:flavin reductase ActVB